MTLSLNEVEAIAKKATRGAGYPWGLAEEAARATRWLCKQGLDGCAHLADLLDEMDGADLSARAPIGESDLPLCPIITGATISDRAVDLRGREMTFGKTAQPVLLLPFAALAARHLKTSVTVSWPGVAGTTDGRSLSLDGGAGPCAASVTVRSGGTIAQPQPGSTRAAPAPGGWATLNRFAQRTYAPATEESRRLGAGAGVSDND